MEPGQRCLIVTPARNEAPFVGQFFDSVMAQTVRPARWVIVDDGSSDGTAEVAESLACQHSWIAVVRMRPTSRSKPGANVMRAFNTGYESVRDEPHDFVVKLDADLLLPSDYFGRLLEEFREDPKLGISSGVYFESYGSRRRVVKMPAYHAAGAAKMIRKECFDQIGGFVCDAGWDTVDEIRAQSMEWNTRHFKDLAFHHLKPEGSRRGWFRTLLMHGEVFYRTGGGPVFVLAKAMNRCRSKPWLLGACLILVGYIRACHRRLPLLVTEAEARLYRRQLHCRLRNGICHWLHRVLKSAPSCAESAESLSRPAL